MRKRVSHSPSSLLITLIALSLSILLSIFNFFSFLLFKKLVSYNWFGLLRGLEMGSNDNNNNQIVKGKRTKRQRSLSPFGLAAGTVTASGSSSSSGGGGGAGAERGVVVDDCCYYNNNSAASPTTSGEIYESTEEEEDMANCLIMLAQGEAPRLQIQDTFKTEKLSSRKFSSLVSTSNSKAGLDVYECKTCNRSFPSFQALGGHRASHKKPKAMVEDQKKTSSSMVFLPFKEDMEEASTPSPPPLPPPPPSVGVSSQVGVNATTKASKIHECSICGSEFTSGQALGGHMRRHRAATGNNNNQVVMMTSSVDASTTIVESKPRSILPLDLNLPAPEDDHLRDSKFQFGSSTQQAHSLVFSAPALVDCHY